MLFVVLLAFLAVCCNAQQKIGKSGGVGNSGSAVRERSHLPQTNLLFIMFDDLRPELSVYGKHHMITPNFDRLAAKSVVFDTALCQVAVCNPSRNSLLTGIRPDATGGYNFQQSYQPNKILPELLVAAGYETAAYGKIRHWDGADKSTWTVDQFDGPVERPSGQKMDNPDENAKYMKWYDYQDYEWRSMKSSVMPDKVKALDTYPDAIIAQEASDQLRRFVQGSKYAKVTSAAGASGSAKDGNGKYWMTAIGFKMPHTALHVPHKYWDMYANSSAIDIWRKTAEHIRTFPHDAPPIAYRCCAERNWRFMEDEGSSISKRSERLGEVNTTLSTEMYIESMHGYSAAVTYADAQLGKVLDTLDELDIWNNVTIVLTSDHGMHNGEKAIWEKWTLFDESTRVPLMISHPKSPFKGTHSYDPVELVDVFPTLLDLVSAPHIRHIYNQKLITLEKQSARAAIQKGQLEKGIAYPNNGALSGSSTSKQELREEKKQSAAIASIARVNGINHDSSQGSTAKELDDAKQMHDLLLREPSGKSLAPLIVGHRYATLSELDHRRRGHGNKRGNLRDRAAMRNGKPPATFAISQSIRCARLNSAGTDLRTSTKQVHYDGTIYDNDLSKTFNPWNDCNIADTKPSTLLEEIMVMGYSARSLDYRYTMWLHFDRKHIVPNWLHPSGSPIYAEELYDHRGEELGDLTQYENMNIAKLPEYSMILQEQREQLLNWIQNKAVYKNGHNEEYLEAKDIFFRNITSITMNIPHNSLSSLKISQEQPPAPLTGQMKII
jgi:iduronate 2-sulfatase